MGRCTPIGYICCKRAFHRFAYHIRLDESLRLLLVQSADAELIALHTTQKHKYCIFCDFVKYSSYRNKFHMFEFCRFHGDVSRRGLLGSDTL
jgi:hypothetical protein